VYLGIDIGTSGVKSILVDDSDRLIGEASAPLRVSRPRPLWSEQDPEDWWCGVRATLDAQAVSQRAAMSGVRAIGLSGQMLGVTLTDDSGKALRPALLWIDGRAATQGIEIERDVPGFAALTGARAMSGFSAPKLRWLMQNEPEKLRAARWILLPKDYVRLMLTGEAVADRADGSATLLMNTRAGDWDDRILAACGVARRQLPRLVESWDVGGTLRPELCARWGLKTGVPVAGGGGDNMTGGVGAGAVAAGDAYISLGTSGVYFVVNDRFVPALDRGMHAHRHAVPAMFCQCAVVLSAAAALTWIADVLGARDIPSLMAEVEAAKLSPAETPLFTPYLAGERTPHDDPHLTATFADMSFAATRLHLVQAVLEGVALAIADCHEALASTGASITRPLLIGGGARSRLWGQLIAAAIGQDVTVPRDAALGPALGAARLARASIGGPLIDGIGATDAIAAPRDWTDMLAAKKARFRALRHAGR
jgi:xylulokinase